MSRSASPKPGMPPRPMLAEVADEDKLVFPMYGSPKIDGFRAIGWRSHAISRSGKVLPNQHVQSKFRHLWVHGLDGELTVGDPLDHNCMQTTTSGISTVAGEPEFTYHVFDLWNMKDSFEQRLYTLLNYEKMLVAELPFVRIVPHTKLKDYKHFLDYKAEMLEAKWEGIMLNKPDGLYKHGRSTVNQALLLKVKPFDYAEAKIIGFECEMKNLNEAELSELGFTKRSSKAENLVPIDRLGAFVVETPEGVVFKIGTGEGLTHDLRSHFWKERESLLGKFVRYKYQVIGSKTAPRIPVYTAIRDPMDMS